MSANLPPQSPAPTVADLQAQVAALRAELDARPKAGTVTQQFLLGLLLFVGGEVLSYLTNGAVGTMIASVGFALAGLAPSPAPVARSGQRGSVRASLLWALAGIGLALAGAGLLASGGCAGSTYAAERRADVDWTPGPPCHLEVHLDGQRKPIVTVDAPEACEPPPDVCPVPVPQS